MQDINHSMDKLCWDMKEQSGAWAAACLDMTEANIQQAATSLAALQLSPHATGLQAEINACERYLSLNSNLVSCVNQVGGNTGGKT